jgi:hypothetical protein
MVLELAKSPVCQAWHDTVFEVEAVYSKGEEACRSNAQEDETGALTRKAVVDWVHEWERLEE